MNLSTLTLLRQSAPAPLVEPWLTHWAQVKREVELIQALQQLQRGAS